MNTNFYMRIRLDIQSNYQKSYIFLKILKLKEINETDLQEEKKRKIYNLIFRL